MKLSNFWSKMEILRNNKLRKKQDKLFLSEEKPNFFVDKKEDFVIKLPSTKEEFTNKELKKLSQFYNYNFFIILNSYIICFSIKLIF